MAVGGAKGLGGINKKEKLEGAYSHTFRPTNNQGFKWSKGNMVKRSWT